MSTDARDDLESKIIRQTLELTPFERLALAEDKANATRGLPAFDPDRPLPEGLAHEKDRNELRILRRTLEEIRRREKR